MMRSKSPKVQFSAQTHSNSTPPAPPHIQTPREHAPLMGGLGGLGLACASKFEKVTPFQVQTTAWVIFSWSTFIERDFGIELLNAAYL